MPTLEFKGKQHIYAHHLTVPYRPLEPDETRSCNPSDTDDNLIIHGDNLHALKALLPRYANRIKCIYIDPPYNTGNEGWVYNDNVNSPLMQQWLTENAPVDNEDLERHDKWLCMMWPRLHLLKELLAFETSFFRKRRLQLMRYLVFFEQGDTNYSAYVPDLPVCVAVGDTLEETRKEISAAMKFHIECLQEDGEAVPMPTSKLPSQTPSGISAEFVNVEVKSKKQFILPFVTPIISRFKRKRV